MYEHFFRLKENPFSPTPDPNFFYLSPKHQAALEHLVYGVRYRKGFLLITGEVGTGKTTLCRRLLDQLPRNTASALILNPLFSERRMLLRAVLKDFGIPSDGAGDIMDEIESLNRFLLDKNGGDGNAVVIIDEAQHMSDEALEMVRLLSNLETEKKKLLQIILLGQPELRDRLQRPELRQLNQRLSVRFHLLPLDQDETKEYIHFRLKTAGSQGEIEFFEPALHLVYSYTEGYPRRINVLGDRILLAAYSRESFVIDRGIVEEAVRDLEGDQPEQKITLPKVPKISWVPHVKRAAGRGLRVMGVTAVAGSFLAAGFISGGFFDRFSLSQLSGEFLGALRSEERTHAGAQPGSEPSPAGARLDGDVSPAPGPAWSATSNAYAKNESKEVSAGAIMGEFLKLWRIAMDSSMAETLERIDLASLAQLEPVQAAGLSYLEMKFSVSMMRMVGYPCLLPLKADDVAGDRLALLRGVDGNGFRLLDPAYGERLVDESTLVSSSQDVMIYLWRDYYEGQDLRKDASGPWVARLQKDLADLGYYRGVITGYYGALTEQGIRELQRQHHLPESGVPDSVVRMLIAKELGEEVPTL